MSQKARDEAAKTGELPHEFLLRVSRGETVAGYTPTFNERVDAAKAAAPYYAPKLGSTDVNLNGEITYGQVPIPVAERDSLDAAAGAAGGGDPEALG